MVTELYARYFQEMVHYLLGMTRSRQEAEDITQETFLRALANAHLFEEMSMAQGRAWLTAQPGTCSSIRPGARAGNGSRREEGAAEDDTTAPYVHQMLMYLPEEDRVIFYLRHFEDFNATQIGNSWVCPPPPCATAWPNAASGCANTTNDKERPP